MEPKIANLKQWVKPVKGKCFYKEEQKYAQYLFVCNNLFFIIIIIIMDHKTCSSTSIIEEGPKT